MATSVIFRGRYEHGTMQCGARGCQLARCRTAYLDHRRKMDKRRRCGHYVTRTPAAPLAAHLGALRAAGVSLQRVSAASGLSRQQLGRIALGQTYTATTATARAIYSVALPPRIVSPAASILRVQLACANGWRQVDFAALLGHAHPLNFTANRRRGVTYDSAARIIEAMDHALAHFGGSTNSATKAINRGVRAVGDYDADLLHDPAWDGLGGLIAPMSTAEKAAEVDHLIAAGVSPTQAAVQVGINPDVLRAHRKKAA